MSRAQKSNVPAAADKLQYRVATADDAKHLQYLVQSSFRHPDVWTGDSDGLMAQYTVTLERITEKITKPDSTFVFVTEKTEQGTEDEGQTAEAVACFQVIRKSPTLARFATFAIAPKHQGRGLARHIVEHAERYCRDGWGARTMQLNTLSSRAALLQWYRRCGYAETGVTEPFASASFGEAAAPVTSPGGLFFVVMEKEI